MKNLHSLAFYALVTPAIALGSSVLLAEEHVDEEGVEKQQSTQPEKDTMKSTSTTMQSDQKMGNQSGMQKQAYMANVPSDGIRASDLIGAKVTTSNDENVGAVSELIIDKDGQVVAVIVGVGGFLGLGEKDVAIGWDQVTKSGKSGDMELRIDATRDELISAPGFETKE
ncbi:PRC-barrel domain-containing protein [Marinobacter sp.]|uniref:PRC-barrel domain-containing protein n=1 Tax=Marinobacter sp. TaxID=50741 RepID=UPI00356335F6